MRHIFKITYLFFLFSPSLSRAESTTSASEAPLKQAQIETVRSFKNYYEEISKPKPDIKKVAQAKSALFHSAAKTDEELARQREEWTKSFEGRTFDEKGEYTKPALTTDTFEAKPGEVEEAFKGNPKDKNLKAGGPAPTEKEPISNEASTSNIKNAKGAKDLNLPSSSYSKSEAQPGVAEQEIVYDAPEALKKKDSPNPGNLKLIKKH